MDLIDLYRASHPKQQNTHFSQVSSAQLLSHVQIFVTPWTAARQASLPITNSWRLPKLMSTELVMTSNYLIFCHPYLVLSSIFPSSRAHKIFSRIDRIVGHRASIDKFKKFGIISSIIFDQNAMRLETKCKKNSLRNTNMWWLNNMLLNNH